MPNPLKKKKFWPLYPVIYLEKFQKFLVNFYCLEIMESERRLAVDKGFNAAIQEILQVEDVICTGRSRGVLNNTSQKYFVYFC